MVRAKNEGGELVQLELDEVSWQHWLEAPQTKFLTYMMEHVGDDAEKVPKCHLPISFPQPPLCGCLGRVEAIVPKTGIGA